MIGLEYVIPATAFIGVLLFFWGISSMLGGGSSESLGARMQRYAGGTQAAAPEAKRTAPRVATAVKALMASSSVAGSWEGPDAWKHPR